MTVVQVVIGVVLGGFLPIGAPKTSLPATARQKRRGPTLLT